MSGFLLFILASAIKKSLSINISSYFSHVTNHIRVCIAYLTNTTYWCNYFLYLWLTPHKAVQLLKAMKLQKNDSDKKQVKAD